MIAHHNFDPLPAEQILAIENQCREILAGRSQGIAIPAESSPSNGDKVHEQAAKLIELTARLFPPGILEVSREHDPDSPGFTFLVIDVDGVGDFRENHRRRREWHEGVTQIFSDPATWLSICVSPR